MTGCFTSRGRRTIVGAAVTAVLAVGTLAACSSGGGSSGPSAHQKTDLTVAYGTAGSSLLPLYVGVEEGLFAQHGLTVKITLAQSTVGATAVLSGSADLFMGEVTSAFEGAAQGQPMRLVATMLTHSINKLYVAPSITNASQLAGKSVAISATGDSTELAMRLALDHLGVSANGMTFLPTGGSSNRLAALLAGKVAGTVLSEPSATKAGKSGMKLLYDQTSQPFADDGVTISQAFGKANPDSVVSFLEGIVDAVHFIDDPANKEHVLTDLGKYTSTPADDPATLQGYTTYQQILVHDPFPDPTACNANLHALKEEDSSRFASVSLGDITDTSYAQKLRDNGYLDKTWGSSTASTSATASGG